MILIFLFSSILSQINNNFIAVMADGQEYNILPQGGQLCGKLCPDIAIQYTQELSFGWSLLAASSFIQNVQY